ncbi:MAG: polysaccharide deacetylase family protein [Oligoflexia bacterium]|nr:polysaccharide deacetylase family protein [Oligoflexia bacterium]
MSSAGLLTLDVEDWHHANFHQLEGREGEFRGLADEKRYPIERNIDLWIETLASYGAKSTCFVLGEFAKNHPAAVLALQRQGHEIACHGMTHDLIYRMTQPQFREYLKAAIGALGELTGRPPIGFRAPSWSVGARTPWFCDELERAGIRYDSSEFPIKTPLYGVADGSLKPYRSGKLIRIPVTVLPFAGARIPFSSGCFFRLAPKVLIRVGLKRALAAGLPPMVVLHPRELDPDHPRLPIRGWESWVHYARLDTTLPKLHMVLKMMNWDSISNRLGQIEHSLGNF